MDTTPPTVRKLHNKENSTICQNTEKLPQTQQYKQDESTEEYPAGKGTECPPSQTEEEEIGNLPDKEFGDGQGGLACCNSWVAKSQTQLSY